MQLGYDYDILIGTIPKQKGRIFLMRMKKLSKKLIAGVLSLAMVMTAGTLPGQTASAAGKKVKLSATKVTVKVGKSKTVKVKTLPKGAKLKKATWASKKKNIAKVSKKTGKSIKITGVKKGSTTVTCKITYTLKKKTKKAAVDVKVTVKADDSAQPTQTPSGGAVAATPTPVPQVTPGTPDSKSNVGPDRTVTIVGGTSASMVVKDNGTVRKELSTLQLISTEMGQGINLGNTMEAGPTSPGIYQDVTGYETAWSAPITTPEMIDGMHSYGFNTIRIPVAWSSMISNDGKYTIDDKLLGRVEEIANYALNNGMYVIINDHWDYGWWGQFGDPKWEDKAWARYESFWTQISARFKDYSDHLILESANEELGRCLYDVLNENGYRDDSDGHKESDLYTRDKAYELENRINQKFLDIVRASGGNNAYRHLLIAGDNTNIANTVDDRFVMPTDTAENGVSKLSISVHFYDPWSFCGDDASGNSYVSSDKTKNIKSLDKMKKFTEKGYGVIIGEFGVCNPRQDGVVAWLRDTIEICKERGYLPVLWDSSGRYFNRQTCKMIYKDVAEMYNEITGAKGDTDIKESTGKPNTGNTEASDDIIKGLTPVWKWEGKWKKNDGKNIDLDGVKQTSDIEPANKLSCFVRPESCTDDTKITFNQWGYQTFLKLDWSTIKKPCIKVTFEDNSEDVVGALKLATAAIPDGTAEGEVPFDYANWGGAAVEFPESLMEWLKTNQYLQLTFGAGPVVTSIQIYDLGE